MIRNYFHIDLNKQTVEKEAQSGEQLVKIGRYLIAQKLLENAAATIDPLSPENPLIFSAGPLAGTTFSNANRISVGCKSPLTGGVKEANGGGTFAYALGQLAIAGFTFHGASDEWVVMHIAKDGTVAFDTAVYPTTMRDAEEIADLLGAPAASVFKTLVVQPPAPTGRFSKPLLVIIPANKQLDLKKLAKVVGAKKVKMASHNEAEELTGLQVGGISPLALLNKGFLMYIDQSVRDQSQIYISSGQRGTQIILAAKDLLRVTKAKPVDVT